MIRRRVKRAIADKLAAQIIQYNLKSGIGHDEYLELVTHDPITKRDLAKDFANRWDRVVSMMLKYHPIVYVQAEAAHKPKPKAKPAPAKTAPAPKPKAAPVKKES